MNRTGCTRGLAGKHTVGPAGAVLLLASVLAGCAALVLAADAPQALPDIDPLKKTAPVLRRELTYEQDLRPAADKLVGPLRAKLGRIESGAVLKLIVTLHEPLLSPGPGPGSADGDDLRAQHIAALEHAFLAAARRYGFEPTRGLKHSPVVAGTIIAESLRALAALPEVRAIELDLPVEGARIEGGNLISALELQGLGGSGEGIGVAVLDSGIDWTHPELVGQVTAHADFTGTQTVNHGFDDYGHGTKCAGVIAGLQHGMAPSAHLWAAKVLDADNVGMESWIIAALDAVYEFRHDFGGVHVVNMSLGGGAPIDDLCDGDYPAYSAALGQLVNAGIAVFASSGNDGCADGLAVPACISHTISVGAVYDADVGSKAYGAQTCNPSGCLDASTSADMIACYSNSGTYLDVLAPSHCANTTSLGGGYEPCFGGTSAAAPYASGVAAQILSLRTDTTPAELRQALRSTGAPITDLRNGLTRNRIDGVAAYQHLTGGGCTYSITPEEADFDVGGGVGTIQVSTQTGCSWSVQNSLTWVHITAGQSGVGPGTVGYRVDPNPGDEPRTGAMTVAGEIFTVSQSGDCTADSPPDPAFTMTPNPVQAGQLVQFTHTGNAPKRMLGFNDGRMTCVSGGADHHVPTTPTDPPETLPLPIGLTVSNPNPQIGEEVVFEITGYAGEVESHWNFGGPGCAPYTQYFVCAPTYTNCLDSAYTYASAGAKAVTVTAYQPGTTTVIGTAMANVTVQATGSCAGCSYTLSPTSLDFPAAGGAGSFSVTTNAGCGWTAIPSASWITISSGGSGSGSGTVSYSVAANSGAARQGDIDVETRLHTVSQAGAGGGPDPATEWSWTVSLNGQTVVTSGEPSFTHRFTTAGLYTIELEAGNCFGSASSTQELEVLPPPPPVALLVPAAAHAPGLGGTVWRTDLRIFNPCLDAVDVTIEFLPEATDNSSTVIQGLQLMLAPDATQIFDDILEQIPGIQGDDHKGSLRCSFVGGLGCTPLIASRTYNDTPEGTFGQYVPAVPVVPLDQDRVFLTGLVDNLHYRTNVGLANLGPVNAGNIALTVYDDSGTQLGDTITTWVPAYSTRQIVEVVEAAGILTDVNIFSVLIATDGADLATYGSVVDNFTGDPEYCAPAGTGDARVWIPGIAHLAGANESLWRSDITFLNDTEEFISAKVEYVPEVDIGFSPFMIMNIDPGNALYFVDVLGVSMLPPGTDSKGYFVVTSRGDYGVPHMAARTYNLAREGGTFGQNLMVFGEGDLIHEGESGYVPGVGNSPSSRSGFRTNVGVLNTDTEHEATISVTVYDPAGGVAAQLPEYVLPPGKLVQHNVFQVLGIGYLEIRASIEVHLVSGGPVAAYASEIDNRTQDPILVPAIRSQAPE